MSHERQVIQESRDRLSYGLVGCLAFVALGGLLATHPGQRYPAEVYTFIGWFSGLFFAICAVLYAMRLASPSKLTLTRESLSWSEPFRRRVWRWDDVGEFTIVAVAGRRARMICFEGVKAGQKALRSSTSRPTPTYIPGFWRLDLPELCSTLNAARERWRQPVAGPMSLT